MRQPRQRAATNAHRGRFLARRSPANRAPSAGRSVSADSVKRSFAAALDPCARHFDLQVIGLLVATKWMAASTCIGVLACISGCEAPALVCAVRRAVTRSGRPRGPLVALVANLIWRVFCQSPLSVDVLLGVSGALAGRHERKVQSGRLRGQTDIRGLRPQDPVFVAARCLRTGAAGWAGCPSIRARASCDGRGPS